MAEYNKPKVRLHHEFLYLNHETVINALSAFEAGKVDEIIEKTSEAREGGIQGGLKAGPVKGGGGKKKQESIQEELIRTRTWFSAFDSWHHFLKDHDAIGTFDSWDAQVRDQLVVGDTIEFVADVRLSPLHKLLATFTSFAAEAGTPGSPFQVTGSELKTYRQTAQMMETWMAGSVGRRNLPVYLLPGGVAHPRIVGRLDGGYIVGGLDAVEGRFTVVGQVDALLEADQHESAIRVFRGVPATPKEIEVANEAMSNFLGPAKELGIELTDDDFTFSASTVVLRPIAVFR